ncbi:hypothetical protein C900_03358 [Fulvivirga imtechensis AK7]|uniref:Uncharacterized protein n=1 Tax=Fulvivirga imtechensis AK7 TaxID=1237149 RepID=L8JPK9_9BACT|nr:hypothetical protein C900_03358 [Fulvivirga imtechensis AK7]
MQVMVLLQHIIEKILKRFTLFYMQIGTNGLAVTHAMKQNNHL